MVDTAVCWPGSGTQQPAQQAMIGREEERPAGGPLPVAGQELWPVAAKVSLLQQDGRCISARLELLLLLVIWHQLPLASRGP